MHKDEGEGHVNHEQRIDCIRPGEHKEVIAGRNKLRAQEEQQCTDQEHCGIHDERRSPKKPAYMPRLQASKDLYPLALLIFLHRHGNLLSINLRYQTVFHERLDKVSNIRWNIIIFL